MCSAKTLESKINGAIDFYKRDACHKFSCPDELLASYATPCACTRGASGKKDPKDIISLNSVSSATLNSGVLQSIVDTILYPMHVSFGGDIINCGLAFMLLIMIILKVSCAQFRTLSTFCALSIRLSCCYILHKVSVFTFFLTALFWDTLCATFNIITHPPENISRIIRRSKVPANVKLSHYPSRWMILSAIMLSRS